MTDAIEKLWGNEVYKNGLNQISDTYPKGNKKAYLELFQFALVRNALWKSLQFKLVPSIPR